MQYWIQKEKRTHAHTHRPTCSGKWNPPLKREERNSDLLDQNLDGRGKWKYSSVPSGLALFRLTLLAYVQPPTRVYSQPQPTPAYGQPSTSMFNQQLQPMQLFPIPQPQAPQQQESIGQGRRQDRPRRQFTDLGKPLSQVLPVLVEQGLLVTVLNQSRRWSLLYIS